MLIRIDIDDGAVQAALDHVVSALEDWTPAWPAITDDFHDIERRRFASQGEGSWEGWGPLYMQWYAFASERVLRRTGGLERSLTEGAPLAEAPLELVLGTDHHATSNAGRDVAVAEILDAGFTAKGSIRLKSGRTVKVDGVPVPPRKLIDVSPADVERWAHHVDTYLQREIKAAGL